MATIDIRGASLSAADPAIGTNPNPDLAVKAPVLAATTGSNITLSGLQTIDGVSLDAGDRVLVKDQADPTTNGLYNAATGPWTRTIDAANNSQFATGLEVAITDGTLYGGGAFQLTAANPIVLGASALTWARVSMNISPFTGDSGAGGVTGLVPAPPAGSAAANRFLMASGAFTALAAGMSGFTQAGAGAVARTVDAKLKDAFLSIADFGGAGDNATDNTAPLNRALAALTGTGGAIFFPPGKYRFNSAVSFNLPAGVFSVALLGAGQDATVLTWPNASGGMTFNYAGAGNSVHLRDMSVTTGVANGGNGVTLNQTVTPLSNPANTAQSDLFRVTFRGDDGYELTDYWTTCLNISGVSNIAMDTVNFIGASTIVGTGVSFYGNSANNIAVVLWGYKCTFNALNVGISYGTQAQGLNLVTCQWDANNYAIYVQAGGFNLDQLTMVGCQVNASIAGVNVQSVLPNITIMQTLFVMASNNEIAINLTNNDYFSIIGNNFNGSGGAGMTALIVGSSNGDGVVVGNTFFNMATGINLQAGSAGVNIHGNTFNTVATPLTNSSSASTNRIESNKGLNPRGGSTPAAGASPYTYTAGSSPETLYIIGGTVSNIATFGVTIATATSATLPITVQLGPNESVTITYTVAPFVNRIIH
jgi:hypothetical protein